MYVFFVFFTNFFLTSEPVAYNDFSMRHNAAIVDYCRTSLSALSGATAGIIGLTSLYGFIFYFITAFMLSVSIIFFSLNKLRIYIVNSIVNTIVNYNSVMLHSTVVYVSIEVQNSKF